MFRLISVLLLTVFPLVTAIAEEKKSAEPFTQGISFGLSGIFGTNIINSDLTDVDLDAGYIIGGGVLIQKSLTSYFSLGSGLEYRYFKNDLTMVDEVLLTDIDVVWKFQALSVPFHMIVTIKGPGSSLDIHAGATYMYIFKSDMSTDDTTSSGISNDDAARFTNPSQVGVSGGFVFRFRVTDYTDLFMGIMAEYYFTNLLNSQDNDHLHLLNYSFNTGYMYRTNLF